jgi:transposase
MHQHVTPLSIEAYDIDHLGIVAGIVDDIGLVEVIDRQLGIHRQAHISPGQLVKAMILNGLGFVSAPLYLFQEFFMGKATEHLIAPGVKPEHLNDDKLGRVLDKLYAADLTKLFVSIAAQAVQRYGVACRALHLDASSFHVHGAYAGARKTTARRAAEEDLPAINITYGYSREHRPDLKQFVVDLLTSADGDVPLFCRIADGNEADTAGFAALIQEFKRHLDLDALFVADSALYSAENLQAMRDLKWLTRVPHTLKEANQVLAAVELEAFRTSCVPGYRIAEVHSTYAGIPQRWLVVESAARHAAACKQMDKQLGKLDQQLGKALRQLHQTSFNCEADARKAASAFAVSLRYHKLTDVRIMVQKQYGKRGRPAKDAAPVPAYRIDARLCRNEAAIAEAAQRAGRFILASNVLDPAHANNDDLLQEYKAQQSAERGFRFLRDPLFFTSSVFLKTPERVAALAMVMGLCLLVYSLGQRMVRQALEEASATIRHQTGKQTARPTLRWIFQLFQAVHLLMVGDMKQISNLTEERQAILRFLGQNTQQYYLLL